MKCWRSSSFTHPYTHSCLLTETISYPIISLVNYSPASGGHPQNFCSLRSHYLPLNLKMKLFPHGYDTQLECHTMWMAKFGLINCGQLWSSFIKFGQIWSSLVNFDQVWSRLVKFDQVWSSLVKFGQVWSSLIKYDQEWSSMISSK